VTDARVEMTMVNPAFCRLTGYSEEEAIGANPKMLQSGRHDAEFYARMWATLHEKGYWQGEIWNRRKNGEIFPEWLSLSAIKDGEGRISNFVAMFSDISKLKEAEEDLDQFKAENDTYGHTTGDALLQEVARRLSEAVREVDTVARLGGDEFAIVLHEIVDITAPKRIADKIIAAINQPVFVEEHHCHVGTSIGIAIAPNHAEQAAALVELADAAMYAAKKSGRNCYCVHGGS